ncbi:MAG: hypothetical protein JST73_01920 [Actinobacteria bacterium]|nr:hypothetical protein [Actinomycetota bacterium]
MGSTTVSKVDAPTVVRGLPARSTVISASVDGTTGWVLTRGDDAGIWRVPAVGKPDRVVPDTAYEDLQPSGLSIVAFHGEVALLGQRCNSDVDVMPECVRSSGIVEFFGAVGKVVHSTTLWHNETVQAGGTPPVLLAAEPSTLWLDGIDHAYALDTTGSVVETVPRRVSTNLCAVAGDLYALDWNGAGTADKPGTSSASRLTLWKWSAKRWVRHVDANAPDVAKLPSYSCGIDGIMLWTGSALTAQWTPSTGWHNVNRSTVAAPMTKSDVGIGYRVGPSGSLERIDPGTAKFVDLGLDVATPGERTGPPGGLVVAERGRSVLACTYAYNGTSGDTPVAATTCGFTTSR